MPRLSNNEYYRVCNWIKDNAYNYEGAHIDILVLDIRIELCVMLSAAQLKALIGKLGIDLKMAKAARKSIAKDNSEVIKQLCRLVIELRDRTASVLTGGMVAVPSQVLHAAALHELRSDEGEVAS